MNQNKITPVILSGGSGTRLWPLSRSERPKQFLDFTGQGPMLTQTLARSHSDAFSPAIVVANSLHGALVEQQGGTVVGKIILEPLARNTAPAIALAALAADPQALLLVSPSDHLIADVPAFHKAIAMARSVAEKGWLVTFGITPSGPETGYGYVCRGDALGDGVFQVARFVEKPDRATAQGYIEDGRYSWNAGIFLFQAQAYLDAMAHYAPEMLNAAREAMANANSDGKYITPDADAFARSPSDSVDYAIMERAERVAIVPVDMGWSDIGSWDSLHDLMGKDDEGNVTLGSVEMLDTSGCFVRSDGPLVTLCGVSDLIVVATADAIMILPRGTSQDTKRIVERLKLGNHPTLHKAVVQES